jgi:acylpyruvate hydrolase
MRFISFSKNGVETAGLVIGEEVVDLSVAAPQLPRTILGLIQADKLEEAGHLGVSAKVDDRQSSASLKYLPLIPRPPKIVNLIRRSTRDASHPGTSISTPTRLCAHLEPMWLPKKTGALDCGIELAVVLKKGGRRIRTEDVPECISGYSVFLGGIVRGLPAGQTVAVARNADKSAAFGPQLVTPEELPPLASGVRMTLKRNGTIVQEGSTSDLWDVAQAVSLVSHYMTLELGDVITMGALEGPDNKLTSLRSGDTISAEVEHIGRLQNSVADEPPSAPDLPL